MNLSKRLRKWKENLTTQTPVEHILTLRTDVNSFADEVETLEKENAELRERIMTQKQTIQAYRDESREWQEKWRQTETEFSELVKDAPNFNLMERGKLVVCAYAMFAAGTKNDAENDKLRELLGDALKTLFYKRLDGSIGCTENCPRWQFSKDCQLVDGCWLELEAAKLGIEVDG